MSDFNHKKNEFLAIFNKMFDEDEFLREDTDYLFEAVNNEVNIEAAIERAILEAKKLEHEANAIKAFIDELTQRFRRKKKNMNQIRDAVKEFLEHVGIYNIRTPLVTLSMHKKDKVIITDESLIPEEFIDVFRTPSKQRINDAILAGEKVDGAELIDDGHILYVRAR